MKKGLIYIIGLLFLVSCNNQDEVGIKYELTAEVDASGLINKMINPYDNVDFFPDGEVGSGLSVRTKYLIYDESEKLKIEDSIFTNSFNIKTNFTELLEPGNYTIVTIVSIVSDKGMYWDFRNLNDLKTARIVIGNYVPSENGILGIHKEIVSINEKKSITILPKHVGSLYVVKFMNANKSLIRYIYYSYKLEPNTYQIYSNENKIFDPKYYAHNTWDNESTYSGFYDYMYFLPTEELKFNFILYDINNNAISDTYSIPMKVIAGEHKLLGIDLKTLQYDFSDLSSAPKRNSGAIRNSQKNFLMLKDLGNTQLN